MLNKTYEKTYAAVRHIPRGKVATYGLIAAVAGFPGQSRMVGYALNSLPEGYQVPWHRVINSQGKISLGTAGGWGEYQRSLLEAEGVIFNDIGKIDLSIYLWQPAAGISF
ncbi:MAG: MGMT family protein [Candidatus Cloacimonetes bacterium]|nr:MGMT family protein [Candidatus Cloacimonadota bacterium]